LIAHPGTNEDFWATPRELDKALIAQMILEFTLPGGGVLLSRRINNSVLLYKKERIENTKVETICRSQRNNNLFFLKAENNRQ